MPGVPAIPLSWVTVAGFSAAYSAFLFTGYWLKVNSAAITIIWPADAVVFFTLALLRKRDWPVIIAFAVACDVGVTWLDRGPDPLQYSWAAWTGWARWVSGTHWG